MQRRSLHESSVSSEGKEAPTAFPPVPVTCTTFRDRRVSRRRAGGSAEAQRRWRAARGLRRGAGGTSEEAFAVVLDLGLGQGVDAGDDLGPGG